MDALSCVFAYLNDEDTPESDTIRYEEFPLRVNQARRAYYDCDPHPRISFDMVGDDIDRFFHALVMDKCHLEKCHKEALLSCAFGDDPIPLRLL